MKKLLDRLFCKHAYDILGEICFWKDNTPFYTYFMQCKNCGKRKILTDDSLEFSKQTRELFKMWKKEEVEIDFDEEDKDER